MSDLIYRWDRQDGAVTVKMYHPAEGADLIRIEMDRDCLLRTPNYGSFVAGIVNKIIYFLCDAAHSTQVITRRGVVYDDHQGTRVAWSIVCRLTPDALEKARKANEHGQQTPHTA